MHTEHLFPLSALLPPDLCDQVVGHHRLLVPPWAFQPDEWSWVFLRGLHLLDLHGLQVWEVGVGTGLNQILLRHWFPNAHLWYSDYNPDATHLAESHLSVSFGLEHSEALHGQWDLLSNGNQSAPRVDVIVACIPQVPNNGHTLTEGDNLAHYYDPARYTEAVRHVHGLGLNEALLIRARDVLLPGGRVVLNLGGRPGLNRLVEMFRDHGYTPRVIHWEIIPQHAETSLATLARLEREGHDPFEFFADQQATVPLSATEAEALRVRGQTVFHKIYVIEGRLAS